MCPTRAAPPSHPLGNHFHFKVSREAFLGQIGTPSTLHPSRVVVPVHRWQIGWHQGSAGRGSSGLHTRYFPQIFVLRLSFLIQSDFQGGERFPQLLRVT